jgi:hypothetical protein
VKFARALGLIGIAASATAADAESVKLIAMSGSSNVGTAVVTVVANRDQTVTDSADFNLALEGKKLELFSTSRVGPTGRVLTQEERQSVDGKVVANVTIQYTATAAVVTDHVTGNVKSYPVPKGAIVDAIGGLWFISLRPKIGQKAKCAVFSPTQRVWHDTERTYESDENVTVGPTQVLGHKLRDHSSGEDVRSVVDDRGLPLEIDIAGLKLVREE